MQEENELKYDMSIFDNLGGDVIRGNTLEERLVIYYERRLKIAEQYLEWYKDLLDLQVHIIFTRWWDNLEDGYGSNTSEREYFTYESTFWNVDFPVTHEELYSLERPRQWRFQYAEVNTLRPELYCMPSFRNTLDLIDETNRDIDEKRQALIHAIDQLIDNNLIQTRVQVRLQIEEILEDHLQELLFWRQNNEE